MQRRLCISALLAVGLAAGLACAPAAHAATDPYTLTNGFYVNPDNSAAVWSAANPNDGREPAIESAIATQPSAL
jgi:endoglucanase